MSPGRMTAPFVRFKAPKAPWGDYGSILEHGMSRHLGRNPEGVLRLERTGPYIPPISFPGLGDLVVTATLRELLDASGLTGFSYAPVQKARIVRLDWHLWNRSAEQPAAYPENGEPEEYILGRKHCRATAAALGDLWELRLEEGVTEIERGDGTLVSASSWTGIDLFHGTKTRYRYASARAQAWLEQHVAAHVRFVDVELAP